MTSEVTTNVSVAGQPAPRLIPLSIPDEIVELIVGEFVALSHPCTSGNLTPLETALHPISLLSRQWNAVATPFMYAKLVGHYGSNHYKGPSYVAETTKRQVARDTPRLARLARQLLIEYRDLEGADCTKLCMDILTDLRAFRHLTTLQLDPRLNRRLDDAVAFAIFAEAELLSHVQSLAWTLSGRGFLALLLQLPTLRSLNLINHGDPNWEPFDAPPPFPFSLTSLVVDSELYKVGPPIVPLLSTSMSTLVDLSLESIHLRHLGQQVAAEKEKPLLPALKRLHLPYGSWNDETSMVLDNLKLLPTTLAHLSLFHCAGYRCDPPAELLLGLPAQLRTLDLTKVFNLEAIVFIEYLRGFASEKSPTVTVASSVWKEEAAEDVADVAEEEGWTWKLKDEVYTFKKSAAVAK